MSFGTASRNGSELLLGEPGAGRVVRVGEEDELRARESELAERVEVVVEARLHRRLDERAAVRLGGELVGDEALRARQHLLAVEDEGPDEQLDELVRAVADEDLLGRDAELRGERVPEEERGAVRVEVDLRGRLARGGERERRGAEGVLVGGELRDVR